MTDRDLRLGFRLSFAGLLLATVAVNGACSSSDDNDADHGTDEGGSVGTPTGAECPTANPPTYDSFGKAFMSSYCTRCHSSSVKGDKRDGAPDDHNFDTLDEILLVGEHIDGLAAAGPDSTNTKMPPSGQKPSEEERMKLGQWLACETDN